MKAWKHQDRIHDDCRTLAKKGVKSWVVNSPCGSGKTFMMTRIILGLIANGLRVAIYSVRIQNTFQIMQSLEKAGIKYGVVAASFPGSKDPNAMVQVCSLQTVSRRSGAIPEADYVIIDEAHQQTSKQAEEIFGAYDKGGATRIGYTATPVGCGSLYNSVIQPPKFGELIACNAHLPARVFVPESPACVVKDDRSSLKTNSNGDISSKLDAAINAVTSVYGNVYKEWKRLNPEALPAVLFAPDVKSSIGYVHRFRQQGVRCASIDGERVVMCRADFSGVDEYDSTVDARQEVIEGSKDGTFKIVCNRFVLRESVDMPWLYHCIVCSTMTGLSTYLQSVGRVLRYWPHYDHVIIQDHSGSTDLHGFPFEDREWTLGDTNRTMAKKLRQQRQKASGTGDEPIVCPKCSAARLSGGKCWSCGHMHSRSVRLIRELDGTLTERKVGRINKQKKSKKDFESILRSMLYRFKNSSSGTGTVRQAYALAERQARINGVDPYKVHNVHLPREAGDWNKSVKDYYKGKRI